jgi:hypothetical protein
MRLFPTLFLLLLTSSAVFRLMRLYLSQLSIWFNYTESVIVGRGYVTNAISKHVS